MKHSDRFKRDMAEFILSVGAVLLTGAVIGVLELCGFL